MPCITVSSKCTDSRVARTQAINPGDTWPAPISSADSPSENTIRPMVTGSFKKRWFR